MAGRSTFPITELLLLELLLLLLGETEVGRSSGGFLMLLLLLMLTLVLSMTGGFAMLSVCWLAETASSSSSSIGYILITDLRDQINWNSLSI